MVCDVLEFRKRAQRLKRPYCLHRQSRRAYPEDRYSNSSENVVPFCQTI
jgi:hypothetical protein